MAPRRGAGIVPEEPQLGGLTFNEPLSWRAGKPIATGELLRRLDKLSNELREMDQEEVDKDSLTGVAKELAGQNLLGHKDKGVRAFTACCLVDVLKICAPDAPFTPTQLKDIFTLFVTGILPALSDPSHAYNTQHKYVLVSLAEVKSIVLLTDMQNSEALLLHVFSSFFDIISGSSKASTGEQIAKDVEYHMTQILVTLVDEAQGLPPDVVDVIMAQFLRASVPEIGRNKKDQDEKQSTLVLKEWPEAYNMAKTICNACPEKMARYVSQYFNEVIMDVSAGNSKSNGHRRMSDEDDSDDDDETPIGPTEADVKELEKAHRLLRELWRASPPVLQNVIPQLEAELSAENVQLRLLATQTLGDIVSGIGASGPPPSPIMDSAAYPPLRLEDYPQGLTSNSILTTPISPQSFAQTHSSVYHSFMGRKLDKSPVIRSGWTTAIGRILVTSAGGIGLSREEGKSLVAGLAEKLNDADDKVRLAAVKAVAGFNLRDIMAKIAPHGSFTKSNSVLGSLADRCRDRRHFVRVEAMTTTAKLWGAAVCEIADGNESVIEALGAIPSKVLEAFYANDLELNVLLDQVLYEQLIPLNYPSIKGKSKTANGDSQAHSNGDGPFDPDKIRTERILLFVNSLDLKAKKAFFAMHARQTVYSKVLENFLKRCEDFNAGVIDSDAKDIKLKLDQAVEWFAKLLPDPLRVKQDLLKYAKHHDRRSYQLLRFAMGPENDFSTVYKAIKEFKKRVGDAPGMPAGLLDNFMPIIYRSACLVYNRSHQPIFLQYSRTDEHGFGATANSIMREISEKHPEIFSASVKELCKALEEQAPSKTKSNGPRSVDTLKALASYAADGGNKLPTDRKFVQTLTNFALFGTPAKAAKYAVNILAGSERKEMHLKDLLDKSMTDWKYGDEHFLSKLATITQVILLDSKLIEDYNDEIIDITTQQILLQVRTPQTDDDPEWQPDGSVDEECEAKCWAIRILVNRLRVIDDAETAKSLSKPVFRLLNILIFNDGELSKDKNTPRHHKSRLRLFAAQQMLKLCKLKMFDTLFSPTDFNRLSWVTQDPLPQVRRGFVEKLQKYIVKEKLSPRFFAIIFLTAFEPLQDFRSSIMTWIRSRVKIYHTKKDLIFEGILPRLIHLLAHHPDFSAEPDELVDIARYIVYYLSTVATEENLPMIYKGAQRVKQVRDAVPGVDADNVYILSDLTQVLVKNWEEKKGWSMQSWPSKVPLPAGLFAALPSHEVAQEIAEKNYLPDEMDHLLEQLVRTADKKKTHKRKSGDRDEGSRPVKRVKAEPKPRVSKAAVAKKERPAKEKKTPKPKKQKSISTPAALSAERRKSGRGASARKSYADRDSDMDDEEMWDGVASWEYIEGGEAEDAEDNEAGSPQADDSDALSEAPADEGEEKKSSPPPEQSAEPAVEEHDSSLSPAPEVEGEEPDEEEDQEAEIETPPPVTNGKRASRSATKKSPAKPSRVASSRVTKAKSTPKVKAKSPAVKTNAKAKAPISKPAPKKGKGKGKAKGILDVDESE